MLVRSTILATSVLALAGCGSFSSMLGLERHVPDETQVTVRPPLTLPPDYDLMPPGAASPVSSEHEVGATQSGDPTVGAGQPQKEERGFFGKLFHGDYFGNDVDATTADKPAQPQTATPDQPPPATAPAPDVNGTPQAPAPASK
jgi:hypothetical protein